MIIKFFWIALLTFGWQAAWGFSLLGPVANGGDAWQVDTIGYNPLPEDSLPTGPKNLGEEYRRNTPVMYYAYDANFLDYFGSNGVVAITNAFAVLNAVLTNGVDSYNYTNHNGTNLFPFSTMELNGTAGSLFLLDLKSVTLQLMTEQLGLADPIRYAWALHDRFVVPLNTNACPADIEYLVTQRNFDPITLRPTAYVNNVLYGYIIVDNCTGTPQPESIAEPIPPTGIPAAVPVSANFWYGLGSGSFYTNLTWDDVGGLRYLISTNNVLFESPPAGSLLEATNLAGSQLLTTSNLFAFDQATSPTTNNPATLQLLYPGLAIDSVSNYFALVVTTNVVIYQTNSPGSPVGIETTVVSKSYTTNAQEFFQYTFGNVVTNHLGSTNTHATIQTITVAPPNGSPVGTPDVTNVTSKTVVLTNVPSGDFYFFPSNTCGYDFLQTLQTNVIAVTNVILSATNNALAYSQILITHFTNHVFVVAPCAFAPSTTGTYQGIGKMQFVRADFDSLVGQFFQPVTNVYTMVLLTNSQLVRQTFQRVVTQPDFVFSAADLAAGPADLPVINTYSRNVNFDQANIGAGLAGPGTITPSSTITFDKVGNIFLNGPSDNTNAFLGSTNTALISTFFMWGSFAFSTNIDVYPNGADIQNLQNQALISISPSPASPLPNGTSGVAYPATTFTATGGSFTAPFTWSAPGGLPPGLNLSGGGTLSGTPTQSGTFDFIIQLTDTNARSAQWVYSVTIN
jgi:hypothetical protein